MLGKVCGGPQGTRIAHEFRFPLGQGDARQVRQP
jgi:hypothetical protein